LVVVVDVVVFVVLAVAEHDCSGHDVQKSSLDC
jgi:hypothetical protein